MRDSDLDDEAIFSPPPMMAGVPVRASMRMAFFRHGASPWAQIGAILRSVRRPRRVAVDEFYHWRLFDRSLTREERDLFVGERGMDSLVAKINDDASFSGVLQDSFAFRVFARGFGFDSVAPLEALYLAEGWGREPKGDRVLRHRGEAEEYLAAEATFPLWARPSRFPSPLSPIRIDARDGETLTLADGRDVSIVSLLDAMDSSSASLGTGIGFSFHRPLSASREMIDFAGDADVGSFRIVTGRLGGYVEPLRAAWTIPHGSDPSVEDALSPNVEILAGLDPSSGEVRQVIRGGGAIAEFSESHPRTGAPLMGRNVPSWKDAVDKAISLAEIFSSHRLVEWTMLPLEGGFVAAGGCERPDVRRLQLADSIGIRDERMLELERESFSSRSSRRLAAGEERRRRLRRSRQFLRGRRRAKVSET